MGRASLFLSLIGLFLGAFALFRLAEPKLCLKSALIGEITVTGSDSEGHWIIPQCEPLKLGARPAPNPLWIPLIDKASKAVGNLDQIRLVLGALPQTNLTIDTTNYLRWERGDHGLILGFGWLDGSGQIEKSLLSYWVEKVSPDRNAVVREVFVDQLWGLLNGDLTHQLPDVENQVEYKNLDQKLPAFAMPAFNYCQTPYIMMRQLPWCKKKALKVADQDSKELSIWALRPVISSWLFDQIQSQAGTEKITFFKKWMKGMRANQMNEWRYTQPESPKEFERTYAEAKKYFEEILELNIVETNPEASKIVTLVDLRDLELKIELQNPLVFQKVAFVRGNTLWREPTWQPVSITGEKLERVQTLVVLDCMLPKTSSLVHDYSPKAENLIFIKSCSGSGQNLMSQLVRDPIETILVRNDKLEFVQFHMPSLAMAFNLHGKNIENPANWKNFFGWQETRRAQKLKAEQPMAAIEAVRYFRWKFL